jgi:hypothetical protein
MDIDQKHRRIRRWKISAGMHGQLDVVAPPGHPQWTLGRTVERRPRPPRAWLDAKTNAIETAAPAALAGVDLDYCAARSRYSSMRATAQFISRGVVPNKLD